MKMSKVMAWNYLNEQSDRLLRERQNGRDGLVGLDGGKRIFKDIDGKKKVGNLELPGLLELPTGSCDALILRAAHNSGFGYVPINEYIRDRQSILDKHNANGIFLSSHDASMKALLYKTTQSLPF